MELYNKIQNDGVEYAGAQISNVLMNNWLRNYNLAYQFILQELDGASKGNQNSKKFAQNSGISHLEYNGAMQEDMPDEVEQASLFLVRLSMDLQPLQDLVVDLRLEILREVMKFYKIGIYKDNVLYQDGLLDNLEPFSLLDCVEAVQPWTFVSLMYDLDVIHNELPSNYNVLMPILYATRFVYAGLYNQGRIAWEDFDEIDNNHFMATMIKIGNRISKSEQVYFQEKSNEKALELLQEYEPLIDKEVIACIIRSAKNKFSLQEIVGDDLIVTSYLTVCYYSEFGYNETIDKMIVRKNFIDMLNRL